MMNQMYMISVYTQILVAELGVHKLIMPVHFSFTTTFLSWYWYRLSLCEELPALLFIPDSYLLQTADKTLVNTA
jgi:hypothetical protein